MTSFEFTIIVLLATIVVLLIVLLRTAIEGFHGVWQKFNAGLEQLCDIEVNTHHASSVLQDHIAPDVKIIGNNFLYLLDESKGLPALVDIVDKMHRNLCVEIADKMVDRVYPPTYVTPCYAPNGICTNPQMDCINCPKRGTGGTWSTTINKVELTDNDKSANSVSITEGRTDVTDGTLPDGAIIMQ